MQLVQYFQYQQLYLHMIDDRQLPPSSYKLKRHQLNNQGCKCKLCQKIVIKQTMQIIKKQVIDHQSQCYSTNTTQSYIQAILLLSEFDSNYRKIKFCLPQICTFINGNPDCLLSKKRDKDPIVIIRNKSKLHIFQVFNFFLEGFMFHNPGRTEKTDSLGRKKSNYLQLLKTQAVVLGKYEKNGYQMLNLTQLEGLFKSKMKYLKDGLMYVQTLVGSKDYCEERVKIMIDDFKESKLFERAKRQVKIMVGEIKSTDNSFITENQENNYEKELKKQNPQEYFKYFVLKIILLLSKKTNRIMMHSLFKLVLIKDLVYLWDIRVYQEDSSQPIWSESVQAAYQYKLTKQMKKMEEEPLISFPQNGFRTKGLSQWLNKSTHRQWSQMLTIRKRLDKLQTQKRSLMQSQSCDESQINKSYKIRTNKRQH